MAKFQVSANGQVFGFYESETAQDARNACAVDAGYKSEADMVAQLEQPSELEASEIALAEVYASNYSQFIESIDPDGAFVTSKEEFDALAFERRIELAQSVIESNA